MLNVMSQSDSIYFIHYPVLLERDSINIHQLFVHKLLNNTIMSCNSDISCKNHLAGLKSKIKRESESYFLSMFVCACLILQFLHEITLPSM